MSITVVLGAQWGDEGKGKLVDILASPPSQRPSALVPSSKPAHQESSPAQDREGASNSNHSLAANGDHHTQSAAAARPPSSGIPTSVERRHPIINVCARSAGGANAGHTIVAGSPPKTYHFHILPSGLLHPNATNLIGSGCVINVPGLFQELDEFLAKAEGTEAGATAENRLLISERAHVVTTMHLIKDGLDEEALGSKKVGTTKKGIGPTYSAKMARTGLRICDLFEEDAPQRLRGMFETYRAHLSSAQFSKYDPEEEWTEISRYLDRLRPLVVAHPELANSLQSSESPANVLVEGANALMLDIDYGTYPFVTSSSTGLGGVIQGLALNPRNITNCIGVVKAYTTRVGSGPFPSECSAEKKFDPEIGDRLQEIGREFGVTTGRKRRCGWLDLVVVRYSCLVNYYDSINLTKLDVLDGIPEIKVAVAYKHGGRTLDSFPASAKVLDEVDVVYETLQGWSKPTTGIQSFEQLPLHARKYVRFIESHTGVRVGYIGTGPGREHMIWR